MKWITYKIVAQKDKMQHYYQSKPQSISFWKKSIGLFYMLHRSLGNHCHSLNTLQASHFSRRSNMQTPWGHHNPSAQKLDVRKKIKTLKSLLISVIPIFTTPCLTLPHSKMHTSTNDIWDKLSKWNQTRMTPMREHARQKPLCSFYNCFF